jgi:hypothetical protein
MNNNILKQAYKDIFDELVKIIELYHSKGASYKELKKYYTRSRNNFDEILEDIKQKSIHLFDKDEEYKKFVKEILVEILSDKEYAEKDKKNMARLTKFESFKLDEKSENYMYVVYTNDDEKHSAWDSSWKASKQMNVLKDNGYRGCYLEYEPVAEWVENGHYFV